MRSFRDADPVEGGERLITLVSRLVLLSDGSSDAPLSRLREFARALVAGDSAGAYSLYHALVRSLMKGHARRVSGDLLTDHLISLVIEGEHPFALTAASGMLDEAELAVFRSELSSLGELSSLSGEDLVRMALERHRELQLKPRHAKDDIAVKSAAIWSSGAAPSSVPAKDERPAVPNSVLSQLPPENEWTPLKYGDAELRDEFASDEALEDIYAAMMRGTDWRSLSDDLWNLFASYGAGRFLRSRTFRLKNGEIVASEAPEAVAPLSFMDNARSALTDNVIAFMRDRSASPVMILGPAGSGRTTLVYGLVDELPELRLLTVGPGELKYLPGALETLSNEPLRFLVLLDDLDYAGSDAGILLCECTRCGRRNNILLAATARDDPSPGFFPALVRLSYPSAQEFADAVSELVSDAGITPDRAAIKNAAVDMQVDLHERLTAAAASALATKLINDMK